MAGEGNILIADESALHALMHSDWGRRIESSRASASPLHACASTLADLQAFNVHHPLYGPPPVTLLVRDQEGRRQSAELVCRNTTVELPAGSFFQLREGLFMATPQLVFVRMARFATESQLAEIAMNLCGRYYINYGSGEIEDRTAFLTTPEQLRAYASYSTIRGSKKALSALRWVLPNSGSPYETKMKLQFCHPVGRGGFGLPFDAMNYDVRVGRLQRIMDQSKYSIDMVDTRRRFSMEYDGGEAHDSPEDTSRDKRRRNELATLGWRVFPIDKRVLHDPTATIRAGEQAARQMRVRLRRSNKWMGKFMKLRSELGL